MSVNVSKIFQWLGLLPSDEQRHISQLIKNGYPAKVVGRGTVMVDSNTVFADERFQQLRSQAKEIVDGKQ